MKRLKRWLISLVVLGALGGSAFGVYRMRQGSLASDLPVAPARKGDFLAIIRCRGDLKAGRSVSVYTPMVPNLRIAWMAPAGEPIEAGAAMIRFDSSSAQQQLMQKEAQLKQAQASLEQAIAQARITTEQDQNELKQAKFQVEQAKLEVIRKGIKSKIDGEQAKVDLAVAEQKLKVQEATVALNQTSSKAKLASLTRVRDQAEADVELMKSRIEKMEIKAPIGGIPVYAPNYTQGWANMRPFKVGDNAFSGMNLAEIPDLATLEMDVKVEETDRGRVAVGNDVRVRIDSLPELNVPAKLDRISPLAEVSTNEWPPTRTFRAYAKLAKPDPRLRPGMNGGMDIIVNRLPDAISIPSKALFTRDGKPVVYIVSKGSHTAVQVEVEARNPDEVAIKGVPAGAMVALVDIEKKDQKK
jgi:HlyD family secretion protein